MKKVKNAIMDEIKDTLRIFSFVLTAIMWVLMNLIVVLYLTETSGSIIGFITLTLCFFVSSSMGVIHIVSLAKGEKERK